MTPENIAALEKNYHHWATLRDAFYIKGLNNHEKDELTRAGREFFGPNYQPDWWCGNCAAEAVKQIYTQYDKIKDNEGTNN